MGIWQICLHHILIYTEGKQGPRGGMSCQVHRRNRIELRPGSLVLKLLAEDANGYFSRCYNQMPNRKRLEGRKSYFGSQFMGKESIMAEQARRLVHKFGSSGEPVLVLGVFLLGWWLPIQGGSSLLSSTFWKCSGMCFPGDSISREIDNDNHKSTPCQFDTEHITLYEHSTPHGHLNTKCIESISESPSINIQKSKLTVSSKTYDNLFPCGSL